MASEPVGSAAELPLGYWVSIDGVITDPAEARVSVFDHAFIYGDSVYEALRTHGRRLFEVNAHWDRLVSSAASLYLELPFDRSGFRSQLEALVEAGPADSDVGIRIMVSRGVGPLGLSFSACRSPKTVGIAWAIPSGPHANSRAGVAAIVSQWRRVPPEAFDAGIKSGNYLNNAIAYQQAREQGAFEAVMLATDGTIAEATTSNVFWVRGGDLFTPRDHGILRGVTRGVVIRLAAELKIPIHVGDFPESSLVTADEAFITSTLKGVLPVVSLDGAAIGVGEPGPVTRRLQASYDTAVQQPSS